MDERHPITLPARILLLLTFLIVVGGTIGYISWTIDELDGTYPLLLLAMPVLVVAMVFFALGYSALHWLGIPFYTPEDQDGSEDQGDEE